MRRKYTYAEKKEKKPAPPPAASRGNAKPIMTGPGSGLTTEVMRKILCDEAAGHVNKHDYHKAIKDYDVIVRDTIQMFYDHVELKKLSVNFD
ncbi:hypothetical protein M8J76_016439 [Diaphorina citri]|nr:hypothetical protein M8J76_016439 [Diaphorina citri]